MPWTLSVVSLGDVPRSQLELAAIAAQQLFEVVTVLDPPLAEPKYAYNPSRKQFNAASIVRKLGQSHLHPGRDGILAITVADLFEPELDFVLGSGDNDAHAAVIGLHRLGSFDERLPPRLQALAGWAVGHAMGLRDCDDSRCLMKPAEVAADLERRSQNLCTPCRTLLAKGGRV